MKNDELNNWKKWRVITKDGEFFNIEAPDIFVVTMLLFDDEYEPENIQAIILEE